jgi:two-component system, NtrC family, nitrogen regulation sensor histidine kinase NtrY
MENTRFNFHPFRKTIFYSGLGLVFLLLALIFSYQASRHASPENIRKTLQKNILQNETCLSQTLNNILKETSDLSFPAIDSMLDSEKINSLNVYFFLYENDSLAYWSDNAVPVPAIYDTSLFNKHPALLANGIYLHRDSLIHGKRLQALCLVKHQYPFQNKFLLNDFHEDYRVPPKTDIAFSKSDLNIFDSRGEFLFSVIPPDKQITDGFPAYMLLFLYAFLFLSVSAAIYHFYLVFRQYLKSQFLLMLAFAIDIIILRALMFIFRLPNDIYNSIVFSPNPYAFSDLIPSLGDFFFHTLTILVIAYVFFIQYRQPPEKHKKTKAGNLFMAFTLFLHIYIFFRLFMAASQSLIIDSSGSLDLNQIFFLSAPSIIALFILCALLFSFFFISIRLLQYAKFYCNGSWAAYIFSQLLSMTAFYFLCRFFHHCDASLLLPVLIYSIVYYILSFKKNTGAENLGFTSLLVYLFLFTLLSSAVLTHYNIIKEKEQRRLMALQLSSGEDPLTEYLLHEVCTDLKNDTAFLSIVAKLPLQAESENQAIAHIEKNYLSDRLRKYEWLITICTPGRSLLIQPENYLSDCKSYFESIIENTRKSSIDDHLYIYGKETGMYDYIAQNDFLINDDTISIFIELFSVFIPGEGLGYPELLIDESARTLSGLDNYSYARYKNDKLVFKYGDYAYRTNLTGYPLESGGIFFNHNSYSHYIHDSGQGEHLIISKKEDSFFEVIAPFSYLLIFFSVFIFLFLFCIHFPLIQTSFRLNFRNRIQLYTISLIITSFVILGIITVSYLVRLNTSKNIEILSEKTHSVLIELEHKLAGEQKLDISMYDYLTNLLVKFSQVFFSDIHLYDLEGNLLASSRPQIFRKQLISARMNTEAFHMLTIERKFLFIHTENIGRQKYYSAYVPFMNTENQVVAYLNLPYFARQTGLQRDISYFLNTFLNFYVLMIALAIFIALLISRYITSPLQLIRNKMGSLSFGSNNEKIDWSGRDEIGTLVAEYNRMIDELSVSAEKLARSERESAWREMARQVAHEIKNPLTPMKLSVQHLRKSWKESLPDWEKRLDRFTSTMIEHIDNLSAIAGAFSDFAKMPQKHEEKVDLSEAIPKSINLFSDIDNIKISFHSPGKEPCYVLADKNQLIRVFNNLIQNAVQAIGKEPGGLIDVSVQKVNGFFRIKVTDNGPGIAPDMMDKIFSPSFTTKSSGMGLGLALVSNIIIEAGGEINFESFQGKGTVFIIKLPEYKYTSG